MRKLIASFVIPLAAVLMIALVPGQAHAAEMVVVTFDATGGRAAQTTRTVAVGEKYGSFPKTTRNGYFLAGWYTAPEGGEEVTASTKVAAGEPEITLFARWAEAAHYILNTNGGKASSKYKDVKPGSDIGSLPSPTRSGYSFMGWYTSHKHGGSKVTASTNAAKSAQSVTIYARWAPAPLYQFDSRWRSLRYVSTMRGSGCGLTAMSIPVRAISGKSITPRTARRYALDHNYDIRKPGRTKTKFFTKWPAKYGIKVTASNSHSEALQAVEDGNWVVSFMKPGRWTRDGHFIVWYDISGSSALIRDPNATKASKVMAPYKTLQSQTWTGVKGNKHHRYYIVEVPDEKKLFQS